MAEKHSGPGIASFVISLVTGILLFVLIVMAAVVSVGTQGRQVEESPVMLILGLAMLALVLVDLVALGLGIGGLCQKDRQKIFAILGTAFSTLTLLAVILLLILGSQMSDGG